MRLIDVARCPRCLGAIAPLGERFACQNAECGLSKRSFMSVSGQPVLVDFEASIFTEGAFQDGRGSVRPRDDTGRSLKTRLRELVIGSNPVAAAMCARLVREAKRERPRPAILVIGGGAVGSGASELYERDDIDLVCTDVYASRHTHYVADAHKLPFATGAFDAIWIQAVLEHVLDPAIVVAEIHRVLRPGGLVYADTTFMQQVHEGAYDFTRFTLSGHRWLFRSFEEVDSGPVGGAGTATIWSIRYLLRALGAPDKAATALTLPFFALRFLDRVARRRNNADAACGVYFMGRRSEAPIRPADMLAYYERQAAQPRSRPRADGLTAAEA
jgi:SAM-dependent methyltransferase